MKRPAIDEFNFNGETASSDSDSDKELLSQEDCLKWKSGLQGLFKAVCAASGKSKEEIWAEVEEYAFALEGDEKTSPDDADWVKQIIVYDADVDRAEATRVASRHKDRHPAIEAMNVLLTKYI